MTDLETVADVDLVLTGLRGPEAFALSRRIEIDDQMFVHERRTDFVRRDEAGHSLDLAAEFSSVDQMSPQRCGLPAESGAS